ncbi:putative F-box/LRR-repeat protein 9 [Aegilops tauschii subsp. strangulata]|uniref:putative F-box/LRR-repeat protein 9 n=1 Tax=Aegilops tauschii subsp. strangulata TaxID=200361 RepID=UPI003CC88825
MAEYPDTQKSDTINVNAPDKDGEHVPELDRKRKRGSFMEDELTVFSGMIQEKWYSRGMELQPDAPPAPVPSDRDWSEMPLDALTLVFAGLGAVEVLMGAGLVCHSWLEAAKAPELWRKVDMGRGPRDKEVLEKKTDMSAMAKVAVDRSNGKLEVFVGETFVTDEILNYIGARSPLLKGLALSTCHEVTREGFTHLVNKSPLLEDIELSGCIGVGGDALVAAGRACLRLRRLGLACIRIMNEELMAIVDGCPCLEHLSVVNCYGICVDDALIAKCATVKTLELPTSQDYHYDSDEYDDHESGAASNRSWMSEDYAYNDHDSDYDYEY